MTDRKTTAPETTARKRKSASCDLGYGKPPRQTQFRKGRSGNPRGQRRLVPVERAKALVLSEAYRKITIKQGDRTVRLPAVQAVLRSYFELAAQGNVQAQRTVLAVVQDLEFDNALKLRHRLPEQELEEEDVEVEEDAEDEETADEDEPADTAPPA